MYVVAHETAIDPEVSENKVAKSTSKQAGADDDTLGWWRGLGWGGGGEGREETVEGAEVKGSDGTGSRIDTGRAEMKCENKQQNTRR